MTTTASVMSSQGQSIIACNNYLYFCINNSDHLRVQEFQAGCGYLSVYLNIGVLSIVATPFNLQL